MSTGQMLSLLRHRRQFRWLFLGLLTSRIGDYFNLVAISWLLLEISGPRALGTFLLIQGLSGSLSGPVVGVLLERFGLRRLVALDNLLRAALVVAILVLLELGSLSIGYLYAFALAGGLLCELTELGQSVAIPLLVDEGELLPATTLMSAIWDASAWLGPGIAGFVVEYAGMAAALAVDAASFVIMAATALALPRRLTADSIEPTPTRHALREGFKLGIKIRPVAVATVAMVGLLLLTGVLEVYYPVFSHSVLHIGPGGYGLLMSFAGLGGLIGTLLLTPRMGRVRPSLAIGLPFCGRLIILLLLAVTVNLPVAICLVIGGSSLDGPLYALIRGSLQQHVPAEQRGRVSGAVSMVTSAAFPAGTACAGFLMASAGTRATLLLTGVVLLPLPVFIACTRILDEPPAGSTAKSMAGVPGAVS